MKIDLFKLNNLGSTPVSGEVVIPNDMFGSMDIVDLKNVTIDGELSIDYEDDIYLTANLSGTMVLKDAYTLEPIDYPFDINIDENIGKYEDFYSKNKNALDILPFLWENIVSEVPIRCTVEDKMPDLKGDGWSLIED
ncbi:MAG: DUF177 domain-containing protein [Bacilli bacterium]|nr:DUF177 domain-containing protein [Bacilli bacterium]